MFLSPVGSTLVQYVDDLLCAEIRKGCEKDTMALLVFLAENGHEAPKSKLQLVRSEVH